MTANIVISEHSELQSSGQITHDQIDVHVSSSYFLILSSSVNVPPNARKVNFGNGLIFNDEGPGNDLTISIDEQFLTSSNLDAQFVVTTTSSLLTNAKLLVTGPGINLIEDATTVSISLNYDFVRSLFVFQERVTPEPNGTNLNFYVEYYPYPSQSLMLYVNGMLQMQGPNDDYELSGSTINMLWPPNKNANIFASYPRTI